MRWSSSSTRRQPTRSRPGRADSSPGAHVGGTCQRNVARNTGNASPCAGAQGYDVPSLGSAAGGPDNERLRPDPRGITMRSTDQRPDVEDEPGAPEASFGTDPGAADTW